MPGAYLKEAVPNAWHSLLMYVIQKLWKYLDAYTVAHYLSGT